MANINVSVSGGTPVGVNVGESTIAAQASATAAAASASAASASAATALAASGPNYASTAAGLAATSEGDTFAVVEGDTIAVYRHDAGPVATFLRRIIQDPEAASAAGLIGSDEGTVQGFIDRRASVRADIRGRALPMPVGFHLPDPATVKNAQRVHMGQPPAIVFGDGTKWWELTGGTEVAPWWLPKGAVLHVDFENSRFYWDGAVRALGDLTDNGDGSYDLAYTSWFSGNATVEVQYEHDYDAGTPTGTLFSWNVGTSERVEIDLVNSPPGTVARLFVLPTGVFHNAAYQRIGTTQTVDTSGRRKFFASIGSGAAPICKADNWDAVTSATAAGTLTTPTKLTFGRRARFDDAPYTNGTLHSITIWNRRLTAAELEIIGQDTPKYPVHLLGDSFLNMHRVYGNLAVNLVGRGYVPITQDHLGGSTLAEQAVRYATSTRADGTGTYDQTRFRDATLVICDFGLSDTADGAVAAIKSMLSTITHDRWLYLEPAPNEDAGTSGRTDFDARVSAVRDFVGDRFVSTLDKAQALSTGSAGDLAELAKNKWPLSIKTSVADFHPNETGYAAIAGWIYDALVARGWA